MPAHVVREYHAMAVTLRSFVEFLGSLLQFFLARRVRKVLGVYRTLLSVSNGRRLLRYKI